MNRARTAPARPPRQPDGFDVWLGHSLRARYRDVLDECIPDWLLQAASAAGAGADASAAGTAGISRPAASPAHSCAARP